MDLSNACSSALVHDPSVSTAMPDASASCRGVHGWQHFGFPNQKEYGCGHMTVHVEQAESDATLLTHQPEQRETRER